MPILEKRYAEALVDISVQNNDIDAYQKDLEAISDAFSNMPDFKSFLLNPETDVETKKSILQKIFKNNVKDEVLHLILLLIDKARIKFLPGIFEEFVRLADEKRSILNMRIISAVPLSQLQLDELNEKFRKLYNASSVKTSVETDASLIGGVKVIIGDKLIDGTVKGMLKNLQYALLK
jgi:F-type H+-transporting ATPase subunit delta